MRVIQRAEWGAKFGLGSEDPGPEKRVVIHHSYRPALLASATMSQEAAAVRGIEKHHTLTNGWVGIGYNFLVAPSGRVFEGRGWKYRGAHAGPVNGESIGICLLIDGTITEPGDQVVKAVRDLISIGLALGEITDDYKISGHRDHMNRTCPGDKVYARLQTFRHDIPHPMVGPDLGSQAYSTYFKSNLTLVRWVSDVEWYFTVNADPLKHGIVKATSPWSAMAPPR